MYYAGIGSRQTPQEVLNVFYRISQYLAKEGADYIYIDSKRYKHIFKKYKEEGNKKYYYDEDKTGLSLVAFGIGILFTMFNIIVLFI